MDATIIANLNAVVTAQDEVWHLGDVARRSSDVPAPLAVLDGPEHLLRGNKDPGATVAATGWAKGEIMRSSSWTGASSSCATTPFDRGTANIAARSTCMAIATAGSRRCRTNTMSASIRTALPRYLGATAHRLALKRSANRNATSIRSEARFRSARQSYGGGMRRRHCGHHESRPSSSEIYPQATKSKLPACHCRISNAHAFSEDIGSLIPAVTQPFPRKGPMAIPAPTIGG